MYANDAQVHVDFTVNIKLHMYFNGKCCVKCSQSIKNYLLMCYIKYFITTWWHRKAKKNLILHSKRTLFYLQEYILLYLPAWFQLLVLFQHVWLVIVRDIACHFQKSTGYANKSSRICGEGIVWNRCSYLVWRHIFWNY